jgi:hypothetical protein
MGNSDGTVNRVIMLRIQTWIKLAGQKVRVHGRQAVSTVIACLMMERTDS